MVLDRFNKYLLFFIFLLFFWDIGNIYAPRQGTEALYMQISQEMHETQNFQVPHYRGERHWSKPPLHFWIPQVAYDLMGEVNLTIARSLICLLCLICAFLAAQWSVSYLGTELTKTFFFLIGTVGMLKFSRVYLMEISLTFLPFLSSLFFFSFLKNKSIFHFLTAFILSALAILIKGPVSIVMTGCSVVLYAIYLKVEFDENIFKQSLSVGILSIFFGGIWYLVNYIDFGKEFTNYFFLRENFGKFGSEKHSPLKIVEGLLVYSYPLILFLPLSIKNIVRKIKQNDKITIFLLIHFLVFFCLWFIPSQRSSQYAMPCIPYLLLLLLLNYSIEGDLMNKIVKVSTIGINILILIFILILIYFSSFKSILLLSIPFIFISFALYSILKNNLFQSIIFQFISIAFLWSVSISSFYLPYIPSHLISKIKLRNIALVSRRSFYFEEILQKKVEPLPDYKIRKFLVENQPAYAISSESSMKDEYASGLKILEKWPKWKRKIRINDIWKAIKNRNLSYLQENYILYEL